MPSASTSANISPTPSAPPTLSEASRVWVLVAAQSFGGPAGQIAVMHRLVVEEHGWIDEERFLHALNYCMLLPGPEAQQLATYLGWLLHGTRGGLIAGGLFILPGFLSILALSVIYASFAQVTLVQALFFGLKAAVLVIVIDALLRISKRALGRASLWWLAAGAFVALFFFGVPFPLVIVVAAAVGYFGWRNESVHTEAPNHSEQSDPATQTTQPLIQTLKVILLGLLVWWLPLLALGAWAGFDSIYWQQGKFFSQLATVTFGGAYAVLSYVAQQAVGGYGWLTASEMLSGLAMAETTPGPLIQVVQYVGFLGAYRAPEMFPPLVGGVVASLVVSWATFSPCFLWIFAGAPYVERLRGNRAIASALAAITAAVVGVILNLSLWFALHSLFAKVNVVSFGPVRLLLPDWATLDYAMLLLALLAGVVLFRYKWQTWQVLALCCVGGMLYWLALDLLK